VIISLIVAMDQGHGIGIENRLPWRLPDDMKRFRELTMGHHLLVGRKTFASIGKALPGRVMIVLTRDSSFESADCLVVHSISEGIELARSRGEVELFVGGGSEVYRAALPFATRIYLTDVETRVEADTFFPELDSREWKEDGKVEYHTVDERHSLPFAFKLLQRTGI
jgi:dihydrofolate reductase